MSPRPTILLLIAGLLAIAAATRFTTAVHPEELVAAGPYERFRDAARDVPAIDAVRVHERDPAVARKLQRARGSGGLARVTDVAAVQAQLRRGRLAAATAAELEQLARQLAAGELPSKLPEVPDVAPYYRDALGAYPCEVLLRRTEALNVIRAAAPDASLRGEPVLRAAEEKRRAPISRALVSLLVALTLWHVIATRNGRTGTTVERRLIALLGALAVLGWSGLGVDTASLLALALVAAAPPGAPLMAGAALVFFPVLALQRLGLVLLCGGIVRQRLRSPGAYAAAGPSGWVGALAVGALGLIVSWRAEVEQPAQTDPADQTDPAVWIAPDADRVGAAELLRARGFVDVVGAESFPAVEVGDRTTARLLDRVYRIAERRLRTAPPEERPMLEQVEEAASRDGVLVPRSLRLRRETGDGRAVLWVFDPSAGDSNGLVSSGIYRAETRRLLRSRSWVAAAIVFALAALLRAARGRMLLGQDLVAAVLAFGLGAVWLESAAAAGWASEAPALLPVLAIAAFSATWGLVFALLALAAVLPAEFAGYLGAFVLAAGLRYLVRGDKRLARSSGESPSR